MVAATYTYSVDLNQDHDFSDTNEDISAYVKRAKWSIGASQPDQMVTRANTADLILDNSTDIFSPDHASALAGFLPGALLKIESTYSATTRTHFLGWIASDGIEIDAGSRLKQEARLSAEGFFARLHREQVRVPVQEGKTIDQIIASILTATSVYPPGMLAWFLGQVGLGELGLNTYLGSGSSDYSVMDTGINVFNYAGDNWNDGVKIRKAIEDLNDAERGFIFENREGKLELYNRHYWFLDLANAVDATLTEGDYLARKSSGIKHKYGASLLNDYTITIYRRVVDSSPGILGRMTSNPRIIAGKTSDPYRIRFNDDTGNDIGGKSVTFDQVTDWNANGAEDGSGANLNGNVSASIEEIGSGLEIVFTNAGATDAYIIPGSADTEAVTAQGIKITHYQKEEINVSNEASILQYGRSAETETIKLLDDINYARNLAKFIVDNRKDPVGVIEKLYIQANKSDALMTQALTRKIGDRLSLSESKTAIGQEYFIVGEQHEVEANGRNHVASWVMKAASVFTYWILGHSTYGKLGQTTNLGFG